MITIGCYGISQNFNPHNLRVVIVKNWEPEWYNDIVNVDLEEKSLLKTKMIHRQEYRKKWFSWGDVVSGNNLKLNTTSVRGIGGAIGKRHMSRKVKR